MEKTKDKESVVLVKNDPQSYPHASRRSLTYAKKGMVATSEPHAAEAGREILAKGGNAIDAAIATAAALTVTEPTSNGIGGDAFAILSTEGKLHALNASGKSPADIDRGKLVQSGLKEMPVHGALPVTVPGTPSAWAELSERFGNLSLQETLAPAIRLAKEGFPVAPVVAAAWRNAFAVLERKNDDGSFAEWFRVFAPKGRPPHAGEIFSSPDHARTLESIAESGGESFYTGDLAEKTVNFVRERGGFLTKKDLCDHEAFYVETIKVPYKGYEIHEIPPNGQGIVTSAALKMLAPFDIKATMNEKDLHRQVEALKLAFTDGRAFITDSKKMDVSLETLLDDDYLGRRRRLIGERAITPRPGNPSRGGTVYLATADNEGNMVSFIQSNYMGFGSGLVVPGTGIALQNRGVSFSLDAKRANRLEGGKRPYHTIIPGFFTKNGVPVGPFGVMGGFMQPQGHLQVVLNLLAYGMNPQAALDAPRWQWTEEKNVIVEKSFPASLVDALRKRGHIVKVEKKTALFGRGQIILRDPDTGVLAGGTDPRADSHIAIL